MMPHVLGLIVHFTGTLAVEDLTVDLLSKGLAWREAIIQGKLLVNSIFF